MMFSMFAILVLYVCRLTFANLQKTQQQQRLISMSVVIEAITINKVIRILYAMDTCTNFYLLQSGVKVADKQPWCRFL